MDEWESYHQDKKEKSIQAKFFYSVWDPKLDRRHLRQLATFENKITFFQHVIYFLTQIN